MGTKFEQATFPCSGCGKATVHSRESEKPNDLLHLLITVFLCGLWIPVWVAMHVTASPGIWRCIHCGRTPGAGRGGARIVSDSGSLE